VTLSSQTHGALTLTQPATPSVPPLTFTAVKAFTSIGPAAFYTSSSLPSPIIYLNPSPSVCPNCCSDFSKGLLSPPIASLVASKTVLLLQTDLSLHCSLNVFLGLEQAYLSLARANATALIYASLFSSPGVTSNLVGPYPESSLTEALSGTMPFIECGTDLLDTVPQLTEDTEDADEGYHASFTYDANPYQALYNDFIAVPFKLLVHLCIFFW